MKKGVKKPLLFYYMSRIVAQNPNVNSAFVLLYTALICTVMDNWIGMSLFIVSSIAAFRTAVIEIKKDYVKLKVFGYEIDEVMYSKFYIIIVTLYDILFLVYLSYRVSVIYAGTYEWLTSDYRTCIALIVVIINLLIFTFKLTMNMINIINYDDEEDDGDLL